MINLCVSFELSKKLKGLRLPQVSQFWWVNLTHHDYDGTELYIQTKQELKLLENNHDVEILASAFLSDELLRWFPDDIGDCGLMIWKSRNYYTVEYYDIKSEKCIQSIHSDALQNALALMLIYLLEHNLLKAEGLR